MSSGLVLPSFLDITPFGPFCKDCSVSLAVEKGIYSHARASHPDSVFKNGLLVREVKVKLAELRKKHFHNLSPFLIPGSSTKQMWFCTCCFVAFTKFSNYKRHFESRCNKECQMTDETTKLVCYSTICGRFGPKACNLPSSTPLPTIITEATTISSLTHSNNTLDGVSCDIDIPAVLMNTVDEAIDFLKPFVRPDEEVHDLAMIFFPLLSPTFEGTMREYVLMAAKQNTEDPILTKWIKAGQLWLTQYASAHIANVSANVRHRLAEFEQQEVDGTTYGTRTFTLRRGIPRLVNELEALLRFLYRFPTRLFDEFKTEEIKSATLHWMIQKAIVPRILYTAAKEKPTNHALLPVACRYCLSRGFTIRNQVQLVMYECGWFSSRISALLHLLRAGVCGYLVSLSVDDTHDLTQVELEVVKLVQNGRVTNLLAPYVKRLRDLNARKPPVKNNTVNANGDITSGAFIFPKSTWSTLIPRIVHIAKTCFTEIFEGTTWENFLALPIRVADWVALEASVETGEFTVSLKDLSVKENCDSVLARLQSIGELCLFGLGVGAVRHEEVIRLKVRSFQWHNSYLYYWTESLKQGSLRGDKKPKLVEHRLSLSMSRIFLLLRYSFIASGSTGLEDSLPTLPGASMLSLLRDIFDFDCLPQMLNVRHFFTSIGNILIPENTGDRCNGALVSTTLLTEKSGHTQGTGRRSYGTYLENSDEFVYDLYHKSLGEVFLEPPLITFTPFSGSILSASLKELLGVHATFRSRQQQLMVDIAANSNLRHSYVGIPCGQGKSLSWFVPTMASYLSGRHIGLRIIVLPYKFLLGHMVQQARSMFGLLRDRLRVEVMDSSDIDEETIIAMLQGDDIPALLFLNLDGASELLRNHMSRLQKLASNNLLKRVYIDEFQQLVIEFGFRSAYQMLRDLGRIGAPVMCLSGSMPISIAKSLMVYCRLMVGDQVESIDVVPGFDPIGDGFDFDVRVVGNVDSSIATYVLQSTDTACHIICDTKILVEKVVERLRNYCNVISVTGDSPSHEQMKCAEQWLKGRHDILVSTSVALVGNENKKCTKIVIGGFLYNISSLVQAIGRLRPNQRGPDSSVVVFRSAFTTKSKHDAKEAESLHFKELLQARCLDEKSRDEYSKIFSPVGLQKLLAMRSGCYLQAMSQYFGFVRSLCGRCGLCRQVTSKPTLASDLSVPDVSGIPIADKPTQTSSSDRLELPTQQTFDKSCIQSTSKFAIQKRTMPPSTLSSPDMKRIKNNACNMVQIAKKASIDLSQEERKIRRYADCVFQELLYRCIACGKASCNGECIMGCYRCGDRTHRANVCNFNVDRLTKILANKGVCFGCFDTRMRGMENHNQKECPLRRRLKRLLFLDRSRTNAPFDTYLRCLYTDEMTFLRMVSSFSGQVTLGRIALNHRKPKQTLQCSQVQHDSVVAPLLPPDIIHLSKDISVDGTARSTVFKDPVQARSRYHQLMLEKSSVRRRRKFVFGAIYQKLFDGYFVIDPLIQDTDVVINGASFKGSLLQVRLATPEDGVGKDKLLREAVDLGRALGVRGNARGEKVGDLGCMHALGCRSAATKEVYIMEDNISMKVRNVSRLMRDWMEDHMANTLKDLIEVDSKLKIANTLSCMPTGPGSRMMVSVNLANAGHVDVDDTSMSVALWLEEKPGQASNWYFVLPNLSYGGSTGVVVKLCHGTVISWDAREIFHCTSKTVVGSDNRVYGCMWGSCKA